MPFFIKSIIGKTIVTKIPFLGLFLLVTLPVLFEKPQIGHLLFCFSITFCGVGVGFWLAG